TEVLGRQRGERDEWDKEQDLLLRPADVDAEPPAVVGQVEQRSALLPDLQLQLGPLSPNPWSSADEFEVAEEVVAEEHQPEGDDGEIQAAQTHRDRRHGHADEGGGD